MKIDSKLYQLVYDDIKDYGRVKYNHCPGIRALSPSIDWINGKVIDLGSGTGDTVTYLRGKGIEADGIDYILPQNKYCQQGDITKKLDLKEYKTALIFDVIEHLTNKQVIDVFDNVLSCDNIIFTIANNTSIVTIKGKKIDLHINKKSFDIWRGVIIEYFDILQEIELRDHQHLYLCQRKQGDQTLIKYLENKGYKITK